jgi:hypothetical protein
MDSVVFVGKVVGCVAEDLGDLLDGVLVVIVVLMRRPVFDVSEDLGEEVCRRLGDRVGRCGIAA